MTLFLYFFFLFIELLILLGVSIYGVGLLFSALKGAPYVPTSKRQLDPILARVKVKKGALFVELGSGDGRFLRAVAKQYDVKALGVEINPLLVWWSTYLAQREKIQNIKFVKKNVFHLDLSPASYVYMFLMPELIIKLTPKFEQELRKGTIIISHGFKIPTWEKRLTDTLVDKTFSTYYYTV